MPAAAPKPSDPLDPLTKVRLGIASAANREGAAAERDLTKAADTANSAEKTAIDKEADVKAVTAEGLAQQDGKIAKLQERHAQEQANLQKATAQRYNNQMAVVNNAQQAFSTDVANQQGFYADKSVGSKVGWAIAVALGGFGAAMNHSQNNAMQILDSAISDDTRLKERKLQGEKDSITGEQNTLGMLRQQGLDDQQSLAANQLLGYQAARTRLQAYIDGQGGPEAKARARTLAAQLDQKIVQYKTDIAKMTEARVGRQAEMQSGVLGTQQELTDRQAQREHDFVLAGMKGANGEGHISGDAAFTSIGVRPLSKSGNWVNPSDTDMAGQ